MWTLHNCVKMTKAASAAVDANLYYMDVMSRLWLSTGLRIPVLDWGFSDLTTTLAVTHLTQRQLSPSTQEEHQMPWCLQSWMTLERNRERISWSVELSAFSINPIIRSTFLRERTYTHTQGNLAFTELSSSFVLYSNIAVCTVCGEIRTNSGHHHPSILCNLHIFMISVPGLVLFLSLSVHLVIRLSMLWNLSLPHF